MPPLFPGAFATHSLEAVCTGLLPRLEADHADRTRGKFVRELDAGVANRDGPGHDLLRFRDSIDVAGFASDHFTRRVLRNAPRTLKIDLKGLWSGLDIHEFENDISAGVVACRASVDTIEWSGWAASPSPSPGAAPARSRRWHRSLRNLVGRQHGYRIQLCR